MIIMLLLELIYGLISLLFGFLELPDCPDLIYNVLDYLFEVLGMGMGFVNMLFPPGFLAVCIPLAVAIISSDTIFKFVMWIFRKIPFFNFR